MSKPNSINGGQQQTILTGLTRNGNKPEQTQPVANPAHSENASSFVDNRPARRWRNAS
ncbi:MAG: hypothetical protein IPO71_05750 [Nitrosomonas sp.]|nr:hypothetical protein [Nitrosomonas sp.]